MRVEEALAHADARRVASQGMRHVFAKNVSRIVVSKWGSCWRSCIDTQCVVWVDLLKNLATSLSPSKIARGKEKVTSTIHVSISQIEGHDFP